MKYILKLNVVRHNMLKIFNKSQRFRCFRVFFSLNTFSAPAVSDRFSFHFENLVVLKSINEKKRPHDARNTEPLPDICRQGLPQSPADRRLSPCPRRPTAHRAPPSLCSRSRCANASVPPRQPGSWVCGLCQTS